MEQRDYTIKELEKNELGCNYRVQVTLPMSLGWYDDLYLVTCSDGGNSSYKIPFYYHDGNCVYFKGDVFLETKANYRFFFTFNVNHRRMYLNRFKETVDFLDNNTLDKISVNYDAPEWAKGAMMYHIFVDRFKRGSRKKMQPMENRFIHDSWNDKLVSGPNEQGEWNTDFYGGDIQGIIQKLDYIKSLGTDIIYLSPVVRSQSNHRYDAGDYERVDPYAGTNDDLKQLCDEAHKLGMKIVLDAVFNHTGNDSKYFNELGTYDNVGAYQDPKNSYYGTFYRKHEDPTNGKIYFDHWWGMPNLPVCDGNSKNWQNYIYGENGVIDKWFDLGIDGLRLDVADELSDEFIEGIRRAVKRNKEDGFILGEVWKNAMKMNRGYISSGKGMDSHMDYPLVDALIRYIKYCDVSKLRYTIQDILNEYPKGSIETLMNFTSTHDISRPINIFGSNEFEEYSEWAWNCRNSNYEYLNNYKLSEEEYQKGKELFKTYLFCMNFMPGILSIFYGDEAGVVGLGNLLNRQPFPWGREDQDLVEFVKSMGDIRKEEQFLKKADMNIVDITKDYFMFERTSSDGDALISINRTDEDKIINIPFKYEDSNKVYQLRKSTKDVLTPYGGNAIIKQ